MLVAIAAALGAIGLAVVLRALPPFSRWNEQGVKPWACDLCMSFWGSGIALGVAAVFGYLLPVEAGLLWLPTFAGAYAGLQRVVPSPVGAPPIPPPDAPEGP